MKGDNAGNVQLRLNQDLQNVSLQQQLAEILNKYFYLLDLGKALVPLQIPLHLQSMMFTLTSSMPQNHLQWSLMINLIGLSRN